MENWPAFFKPGEGQPEAYQVARVKCSKEYTTNFENRYQREGRQDLTIVTTPNFLLQIFDSSKL
jgi:hypothetical protein